MNPDADTAIKVEATSMRSERVAAAMTPADQAIQEPEPPFSIRRRQRGGRRIVAVSSSVRHAEACINLEPAGIGSSPLSCRRPCCGIWIQC
jgi:hypothetical protein